MKLRRPETAHITNIHRKLYEEDLYKMFSRNVSFGTSVDSQDQNIQGQMIEIADSGLANASITITHNLGYVPSFYDIKYISLATQIFDFGTPWTSTQIFLASTTAHTKFRVFVH